MSGARNKNSLLAVLAEGRASVRFIMQPKWVATALFAAGLVSLSIGGGLPYLKNVAIGLTSTLS